MRRVFRSTGQAWSAAGVGIVSLSAVAAHVLFQHGREPMPFLVELTPTLILCVVSYRLFIAGVYVDSRGIEVVNIFGRVRIAWAEISDFTLGSYGRTPQMGYVVLQDGSNRPLHGIRGAGSGMALSLTARSAEHLIDELNELKVLNQRGSGQL